MTPEIPETAVCGFCKHARSHHVNAIGAAVFCDSMLAGHPCGCAEFVGERRDWFGQPTGEDGLPLWVARIEAASAAFERAASALEDAIRKLKATAQVVGVNPRGLTVDWCGVEHRHEGHEWPSGGTGSSWCPGLGFIE